jgi:hypothetical protein
MRLPGLHHLSTEQYQVVLHGTATPEEIEREQWAIYIRWAEQGDRDDDGHPVIRSRGKHFVFLPTPTGRDRIFLGHGGSLFRARLLDGTVIESRNVWMQGEIPLRLRRGVLADNADLLHVAMNGQEVPPPPPVTEMQHVMDNISQFPHETYAVDFHFEQERDQDGYDFESVREDRTPVDIERAQVWGSQIKGGVNVTHFDENGEVPVEGGWHILALDVDYRCKLVPSSTPGHFHLVIDRAMEWHKLVDILNAMAAAGIVESGYAAASIARGQTFLRLPWISKDDLANRANSQREDPFS